MIYIYIEMTDKTVNTLLHTIMKGRIRCKYRKDLHKYMWALTDIEYKQLQQSLYVVEYLDKLTKAMKDRQRKKAITIPPLPPLRRAKRWPRWYWQMYNRIHGTNY
jgi:hypothetical protein